MKNVVTMNMLRLILYYALSQRILRHPGKILLAVIEFLVKFIHSLKPSLKFYIRGRSLMFVAQTIGAAIKQQCNRCNNQWEQWHQWQQLQQWDQWQQWNNLLKSTNISTCKLNLWCIRPLLFRSSDNTTSKTIQELLNLYRCNLA